MQEKFMVRRQSLKNKNEKKISSYSMALNEEGTIASLGLSPKKVSSNQHAKIN